MTGSKRHKLLRRLLLLVMAVCLFQIGREQYLSVRHRMQREEMSESLRGKSTLNGDELIALPWEVKKAEGAPRQRSEPQSAPAEETAPQDAEPRMLEKYAELYEENHDLAGWLAIEGMVIDYPVMQCGDDEYYLHHSFYGEEDKYGCLYVRGAADLDTPGTNCIIYGHNMRDGSMFGDLDYYLEESFGREHSRIRFDTLYEEREYEVMAVFRSRIYRADEETFKYYQFYQADTEEEFQYFYDNVKELSLYDTGVTAEFGDTFITLSTCAYHVEDGRLVVVAKRIGGKNEV